MGRHDRILACRDAELALLTRALDDAREDKRGSVIVLGGEPGIGKTTLMEAAAQRGDAIGCSTLWGRAWELGDEPPYWPWIEVLRTLAETPAGRQGHFDALTAMLPELAGPTRSTTAREPVDAFELSDTLAAHLGATSRQRPILVLLDDLHAADHATLTVAELVARRLPRMPVVLVGSHRTTETRRDPAREAALVRLARHGEALELSRLDADGVRTLVREHLGNDDAEAARLTFEATDGNPLFARELLTLIASRGRVEDTGVPAGVRAVIRERLALLSPATVALLQSAAVMGRDFTVTVVAETAGVTTEALEEATDEALGADLLVPLGPGRLRFAHALVAETLRADLPPRVRARLHGRVAEVLERDHGDAPGAPFEEIAGHYLAAGADAAARALPHLERAATRAFDRMAFEDAALLWERASELVSGSLPAEAHRGPELLVRAGEARARAGQRERAAQHCLAASTVARERGDAELFARAALALGAEVSVGARDEALVQLLDAALSLLPGEDAPIRARVLARLASARQPEADPAAPIAMAETAFAMARRLDDARLLLEVLHAGMGALTDYAEPAHRAELNREAAKLASSFGDRGRELRARLRLAFDAAELTNVPGFQRAVQDYEAVARLVGQPRVLWPVPLLRSMLAAWEGRFVEADRLEADALALRREDDPDATLPPGRDFAHATLRQDVARLESGIAAYRGAYGENFMTRQLAGYCREAIAGIPPQLPDPPWLVEGNDPSMVESIHGLDLLTEIVWHRRNRTFARVVYRGLAAHAGKPFVMTGVAYSLHGLVDHGLMRMAFLLGDVDAAERHATDALALASKLGARPLTLRILADRAHGLLDDPTIDRVQRAREDAKAARQIASQLACATLSDFVARLEQRLAALGEGATPAVRSETLTITREGDVWAVAGLGELCRIRDGRGIQMLATLVAEPHREFHVLDLSGSGQPVDEGDAGEALDETARRAYGERLRALAEELDEAESWNDAARAERLRAEQEALTAELSRATGLGGRARRVGSTAERARVNVKRRISVALRHVADAAPRLGAHLERAVRTGTYCAYAPE